MPDETPFKDAIARIDQLPANEVDIVAVRQEDGDVGATVQGNDDFGKPGGWSAGGAVSWMKKAGWSAVGLLRWKGKP